MSSNHTLVSRREWQEMQRRVAETDAYVINREAEIRRLNAEAANRRREIEQMRAANQQAVNQSIQALADAYRDTLQAADNQISSQISVESDSFRQQFQSMVDRVRDISGQLSRADLQTDTLARQYNEAFQQMVAQTAQGRERALAIWQELDYFLTRIRELSPERFLPGEYATLEALRASLDANISSGDYQAAIAVSQNSILTASRVLTQLVLLNEQYDRQLFQTQTDAAELASRIDRLSSQAGVLSVELNGEQQEYEYDIAYWSNGGFDRICQQFDQLCAQLESCRMSTQEVVQARRTIERLGMELEQCDQRARNALAGSVFVEDTAVRLHNSLSDRGWSLEESGFHADEARNPFTMQYEDGHGNTVSIVVSSGENAAHPTYAIEAFAENERRASLIKDGVHAAAAQEGLEVEGVTCRNDCHLNPTPQAFITNMVNETLQQRTFGTAQRR